MQGNNLLYVKILLFFLPVNSLFCSRNEVVRTRESNLGSFIADIIKAETGADVVMYNGSLHFFQ